MYPPMRDTENASGLFVARLYCHLVQVLELHTIANLMQLRQASSYCSPADLLACFEDGLDSHPYKVSYWLFIIFK